MDYIQIAEENIASLVSDAYRRACDDGVLPQSEVRAPSVEIPKDAANGDFSSTFALSNAKALKMQPRLIAQAIAERIETEGSYVSKCSVAGAGFLNFSLSDRWYKEALHGIISEGERYGYSKTDKPEKVLVEFVSANPTGPMHLGNARGGVLGDCIAQTLSMCGNQADREFLINDAGNQVDLLGRSLDARLIQLVKGEDAVSFPEDGYHGDDVVALAKEFLQLHGEKILDEDEGIRRSELVKFALDKNIAKMKNDLSRYKINYDRWFRESELHESGYVKETMELLKEKGVTYYKDGALWLKTSELGCDKDDVLVRANGFCTYFAADIAYHRDKLSRRGYDRAINIWGADHHGHVKRLQKALDALGLDGSNRLEIVLMQLVRLTRDGEVVRMSKRTGKAISLSDLLDEIPVDAARYFFNSRAYGAHLEFDLGLAVRKDSENPMYYVQYAHARIASIIRNLKESGVDTKAESADLSLLDSDIERSLIKLLASFTAEIKAAAASRDPSRINHYVQSLAGAFHKFYTDKRIKDAPDDVRSARIYLCLCVKTVIKNALSALKIDAPERM